MLIGDLTFFPDGEPCGDAEYDAGGLAGHGLDPDKLGNVDPVEVALDLGDPGPLGSRADVDAGRGQSSRRHVGPGPDADLYRLPNDLRPQRGVRVYPGT